MVVDGHSLGSKTKGGLPVNDPAMAYIEDFNPNDFFPETNTKAKTRSGLFVIL